jgi:hypothetical protein
MKQLDTTQKEQKGKRTNLVDSHDNFIALEPNQPLYNPKILDSMGTGHPSDVLLQDQEPPGHDHSKSFNSRNPTLPTMQMTRLYRDEADVTESAGYPPAAEIFRLAERTMSSTEHLHLKSCQKKQTRPTHLENAKQLTDRSCNVPLLTERHQHLVQWLLLVLLLRQRIRRRRRRQLLRVPLGNTRTTRCTHRHGQRGAHCSAH